MKKKKTREKRTLAYVRGGARGARRITAREGRKECKKSGKRGRKKWEEGAGGRGRKGETNSFNARARTRTHTPKDLSATYRDVSQDHTEF